VNATPSKRFPISPLQVWLAFLATLIVAGVAAGYQVFSRGLVVTNLTDLVPWGLWITIDLAAIAMSAGAFMLCAAVYLLGLKKYQPLARTATYVGLIGYSMAVLCLMMDIGRPERFWHALVYWNPHSLLWEVTMCITLYFTVLVMETAPIIGETQWMQRRFPWVAKKLTGFHNLAPYLAVAGLALSMLHQSSLGAAYGVLKARPFLYRPDLSVLFMASAMAGGPALTVFISMVSSRLTKKAIIDDRLLERLSYFIGWVLVGYLYFRFWDVLSHTYTYTPGRSEGMQLLTQGTLAANFWIFEILLGTVLPIVILLNKRLRQKPWLRMSALAFVVIGVITYRWNVNVGGLLIVMNYLPNDVTPMYTSYFPSIIEIVAGMGVIAYGLLAITLGVRFLNIVNHKAAGHADHGIASENIPELAAGD
jgi:menaquinone reductase, integral membrane subunit